MTTDTATQHGIHRGLSFADYLAIDAVNASLLKPHAVSARHAKWKAAEDHDTDALSLGRVVHTAILEPERYEVEYIVSPKVDLRTKDGKQWHAGFCAAAGDKTPIAQDEDRIARSIVAEIEKLPHIAELVSDDASNRELTVVQPDTHHDLDCKARIDCLLDWRGCPTIVDIKTTSARNLKPHTLRTEIHKFGYHIQAAWYLDLYGRAAGINADTFVFVFCQTTQDMDVAAYQLDQESIEQGRREARQYLQQIVTCRETGKWPGVQPSEVGIIGLPDYAIESTLDDTGLQEVQLG